jgi:hypothetical protein
LAFVILAAALPAITATAMPAQGPSIVPDARVQRGLERAREAFLSGQPFDRLDVAVLVERGDGSWRYAAVGGEVLAYPASCVKLPFLVAAVRWCAERGRAPDCLDAFARPMMIESDNVATGMLVDAVSGTLNQPDDAEGFDSWLESRRFTERLLAEAGLLDGQRLLAKTYPSNSGDEPSGFERRALAQEGRNAMSPGASARLMLAIVSGAVEPQATAYMRSLLERPRFSANSSLGGGFPPGTLFESKIGVAFDTLEEIALATLPNGQRVIIAAFSNGWDPREPLPGDAARLNGLAEAIVRELRLDRGLPRPRYFESPAGPAAPSVSLHPPHDGYYELAVWFPAEASNPALTEFRVEHADGQAVSVVDQRYWGARWVPLGEFRFRRGQGQVTVAAPQGRAAIGRLRLMHVRPAT